MACEVCFSFRANITFDLSKPMLIGNRQAFIYVLACTYSIL